MVMFAVEFHKLCLKIGTHAGEDAAQVVNYLLGEHAATVFRHKDQVNMHFENAMPAVSYFVVFLHRPSIIQSMKRLNRPEISRHNLVVQ